MKNKIKNSFILSIILIAFSACGGSDDGGGTPTPEPTPNTAPTTAASAVYPTANLLCIDNTVTFEWSAVTDPDGDSVSYNLLVAKNSNLTTDIVEQSTVSGTTKTVTLEGNTAFYWSVTPKDNNGNVGPSSTTYAFHTEGEGVSNYAPFIAALNSPENGSSVDAGTIILDWTGGDANADDTLTYDLYFGEDADPALLQEDVTDENFSVTANAATTYYWRVNSTDDSGTKTIGHVWSFNVN